MREYLRVKVISLGDEIKTIKREERKRRRPRTDDAVFWGLRRHRMELRAEARAALLAYGFLRGRPYASMEAKTHERPHVKRTMEIAQKFGDRKITYDVIQAWVEGRDPVYGRPEPVRDPAYKPGLVESVKKMLTGARA